jgi:hypothetical protein
MNLTRCGRDQMKRQGRERNEMGKARNAKG